MSAFPAAPRFVQDSNADHPRLLQRPHAPAERRARWEVRAAQWRARALAEAVFGGVTDMALTGMRPDGALRGMLRLDVPFEDMETHRAREARFLSAVALDPLLNHIPLLYVIGPDHV